jgi:hypothetical protein
MKKYVALILFLFVALIGLKQVNAAYNVCDQDLNLWLINSNNTFHMAHISGGLYSVSYTPDNITLNVTIGTCPSFCQIITQQSSGNYLNIYNNTNSGGTCDLNINITGVSQSTYNSCIASLNTTCNIQNVTATCVPPAVYVNVTPTGCNQVCPACPDNVCQVSCPGSYGNTTTGGLSSISDWLDLNWFWILVVIIIIILVVVVYFVLRGILGRRKPIKTARTEPQGGPPPAYEKLKKKEEEGPDFDYTR